jgi:hypothetical protein
MSFSDDFRVAKDTKVKLDKYDADHVGKKMSIEKEDALNKTDDQLAEIGQLQEILHAEQKQSILIVLQGKLNVTANLHSFRTSGFVCARLANYI